MDTLSTHSLSDFFWLMAIGMPILLAPACLVSRLRSGALLLGSGAALPALLLAIFPPPPATVSWLLLGASFSLDGPGRVFLLFTALLWSCAGIYAYSYLAGDPRRSTFFAFFLLTMAGNLGLVMAGDMITFYLFFVVMTFSAYPLVVHDRSEEARYAGKIYLIMAVMGEALLIAALLLIASASGSVLFGDLAPAVSVSPNRHLIIALVLAGFGIKAGALPLHIWLPLAHPVAPTPASAVLSGAMIKAGLLGWIRFLPLGEVLLPGWGALCMIFGLCAAFIGVAVGLTQKNAKTVLAYSSISQMGLMLTAVGMGFLDPAAWPAAMGAIAVYALHHGLAKGALFLGAGMTGARGVWHHRLFLLGLLLPALALAGAPLTSGTVAKKLLGGLAAAVPYPWPGPLGWLLAVSAVATTVLMTHLLLLPWTRRGYGEHPPGWVQWFSWLTLQAGGVTIVWWVLPAGFGDTSGAIPPNLAWGSIWPVLSGGFLGWYLFRRGGRSLPVIPAGDLLRPIEVVVQRWRDWQSARLDPFLAREIRAYHAFRWYDPRDLLNMQTLLDKGESNLLRWRIAGLLFLLLLILLVTLTAIF
jgi:formate hydrogenlyase subunit 3/multisubunit Na+/H+ antiporter MnhD subunit